MASSFCFGHHPQLAIQPGYAYKSPISNQLIKKSTLSLESVSRRHSMQEDGRVGLWLSNDQRCFPESKSRSIILPNLKRSVSYRKISRVVALCFEPSQIASSVFTIGTAGVIPFYTIMDLWLWRLDQNWQIYHDGLQNDVETRHSISLCLLFCPIGVLTHSITKWLIKITDKIGRQIH